MLESVPANTERTGGRPHLPKPSHRFRAKKKRESLRLRSHTLDLKKIAAWAQVGCTRDEIASLLNVDNAWLDKAIHDDGDLEEAILLGTAEFKTALRTTQARLALSGNVTMLIWLGKQFLGQSDKREEKTETTVNVVLQNAVKELRALDSDTIMEMKRLLETKRAPLIDNDALEGTVIDS